MTLRVEKPKRPILRYHGGKWLLAPWIISHFPNHKIYVEPFGGAASVLLRKARSYAEIYNDIDSEIVNLFNVVRNHGSDLALAIELIPFSRANYKLSFERSPDPFEQAIRTVVRSFMGFGSNSLCREVKSGFRSNANRSGTTPAHDWRNFPANIPKIIDRLRGVVIENKDACAIMQQHDSDRTLHHCDPPYVHSTRTAWAGGGARKGYAHEMSDDDHLRLSTCVKSLRGKVIISGYHSPLYDSLYAGWHRVERKALADGARARVEVLWMNFEPSENPNSKIENPKCN